MIAATANSTTAAYGLEWFDHVTHLKKLEKAATVALAEMPISASAKLNTKKLLGVLSSLTWRKAATVTAFRKNPSRPLEDNIFYTHHESVCGTECTPQQLIINETYFLFKS